MLIILWLVGSRVSGLAFRVQEQFRACCFNLTSRKSIGSGLRQKASLLYFDLRVQGLGFGRCVLFRCLNSTCKDLSLHCSSLEPHSPSTNLLLGGGGGAQNCSVCLCCRGEAGVQGLEVYRA